MTQRLKYLVAGNKAWNEYDFNTLSDSSSGEWLYCRNNDELLQVLEKNSPRYIFFLHWSWRVPSEIITRFECVCFHMTDVPYGRGGSPLQNLIVAGREHTVVSALRMVEEMDAGPVYAKRPMSLAGSAEEIYSRAGAICIDIIRWMIEVEPEPAAQLGEPVFFRRRKPAQSELPIVGDMKTIYNHIRMLDAPSYPRAFVDHGEFRLELSDAQVLDGKVTARVLITNRQENEL